MCVLAHLCSAHAFPHALYGKPGSLLRFQLHLVGQMEEARHCGTWEIRIFLCELAKYKMRY